MSAGIALIARTLVAASVYGFSLGCQHSELIALRNVVKFPLLIVVTTLVCAISYDLVARVLRVPIGWLQVHRSAWSAFHDGAILMASVTPSGLFLGYTARAIDDGRVGFYDSFLLFNMAVVAASGVVALVRQARSLFDRHGVSASRAAALVLTWLALSLAVGGQAAFFMRPFFGLPATRGEPQPWFAGNETDVRGARNFYEMVWQAVVRPPLEEGR